MSVQSVMEALVMKYNQKHPHVNLVQGNSPSPCIILYQTEDMHVRCKNLYNWHMHRVSHANKMNTYKLFTILCTRTSKTTFTLHV